MNKGIIIVLILAGVISLINLIAILLNKFYIQNIEIDLSNEADISLDFCASETPIKFKDLPSNEYFVGTHDDGSYELFVKLPQVLQVSMENVNGKLKMCNIMSLSNRDLYSIEEDVMVLPVDLIWMNKNIRIAYY